MDDCAAEEFARLQALDIGHDSPPLNEVHRRVSVTRTGNAMSSEIPEDGLVLVVREECPTCQLIAPVAAELEARGHMAAIYSQDNPDFPQRGAGSR